MIKDILSKNEKFELNEEKVEALKALFPNAVRNGIVDLKIIEKELNPQLITKEGYDLNFLGKSYAKLIASLDSETVLIPNDEHNLKDENVNSENVYISGDNIDVLKHLIKSYHNSVKCIYIDPPYNTGSDDFIYIDSFDFSKDHLVNKVGISDEEAERVINMIDGKSSSHSAWLTFMYPRLYIARNLLKDDGVIFISIDDNEQANLKLLCDDIFGSSNFISTIVRNTNSSKNQSLFVSVSHEYCLVYAKNIDVLQSKHTGDKWEVPKNNYKEFLKKISELKKLGLEHSEITKELKQLTKYPRFMDFTNYWYFDERGLYRKGDLGGVKDGNMSAILNPITQNYDPVPPGGYRYNSDKLAELIKDNRIHFHTDGSLPTVKRYLLENLKQRPKSIMSDDQRPDYSLMKEFNTPFDNPKQLEFMKRILSIVDKDSIILDFFSGSSTTAHAAMQLNAEDGGTRKFIMVQLPETVKPKSLAEKKGYLTIDQLGMKRIELSAKKIKSNTSLLTENVDLGFKHYRLKGINSNHLIKLEEFNPDSLFSDDDVLKEFGIGAVLTTWMNYDGYGLTNIFDRIKLNDYYVYQKEDTVYVLNPGISNETIKSLVENFENPKFRCRKVVIFGYSFNMTEIQTLKDNLKQVSNVKKNSLDIEVRY